MPEPSILLLRHAQSAGEREHRFAGSGLDVRLSERGARQARTAAHRLRAVLAGRPTRVVTSPLMRAFDTASRIAACLACEPRVEPALRESHFGTWTGRREAEVEDDFPLYYRVWLAEHRRDRTHPIRPPGGETFGEVRKRATAAFLAHVDRACAAGTHLLVVTHNAPLLGIVASLCGDGERAAVGNCALTRLRRGERDGWELVDTRGAGSNWHDVASRDVGVRRRVARSQRVRDELARKFRARGPYAVGVPAPSAVAGATGVSV